MVSKIILLINLLFHQTHSYGEDCRLDPDCQSYAAALTKAKYPSSSKEVKTLHSIRPSSPNLKFDSSSRVLLVNYGSVHDKHLVPGQKFTSTEQEWYSVYPDLKLACSQVEGVDKIKKRINQILGLPPNYESDNIVEVYAEVTSIFRPCPDPEVYDEQCVYEIPVLNSKGENNDEPWFCPKFGQKVRQVGEPYIKVQTDHFSWMCENWRKSYNNKETYKNFPWTGLGYTYDWGSESGIGLSEYIVEKNSQLIFSQKFTVSEYCSPNNTHIKSPINI